MVNEEQYYTAKEAAALLGVTDSAFNNAVYRHGLERETVNGRWRYPQSSVDKYRSILDAKQSTPLQNQSEPTELPPAALQSLDPLGEPEPASELEAFIEEDSGPVEERCDNEYQALEPDFETAMLRLIMEQLRGKVVNEQQEAFTGKLKVIRNAVMACNAMILTSIDNAIAEYEAGDEE